jgi:ribonuclease HI
MTYYAVNTGHNPGIYMTWDNAKKETDGYTGAKYRAFKNIKDAEYFVIHGTLPPFISKSSSSTSTSSYPVASNNAILESLPVKFTNLKGRGTVVPVSQIQTIETSHADLSKLLSIYKSHINYCPSASIVHIYTDGSTIGNGKKSATGGYGVFIPGTSAVTERLITRRMVNGKITNGVAELKAMLCAMEEINTINQRGCKFIIHYDSTYAADVITGKKSAKVNLDLVTKCKETLAECLEKCDLVFQHVYSHTGKQDLHSIGNEIADKLAAGFS